MRATDLILKKRRGERLTGAEIQWLIGSYTRGDVPDYQMSAFCMAVCFKGLDEGETAHLTMAMAASGDTVDLSPIPGFKVDKHSTGGVADTTTLILGPLVASCGAVVAKMSGRGLGHTGGTVDKLESIPGMRTEFDVPEFLDLVKRVGIAVVGQSGDLAPADKKLYALRDASGTVDNMGLIASSIVSKKLAAGADGIFLDVKTGSGAFMKSFEESRELARLMVSIGRAAGKRMEAAITDMDEPLGNAIGNALEVREAIDTLSGRGPKRLTRLCAQIGGRMLVMAGICGTPSQGERRMEEAIRDGSGLRKFQEMISAQGGDPYVAVNPNLLPTAPVKVEVRSPRQGFVSRVDALHLGMASVEMGAGRARKEDHIDPSVGMVLERRTGDRVDAGEPLAIVHAADRGSAELAVRRVLEAYVLGDDPPDPKPLVYEFIL